MRRSLTINRGYPVAFSDFALFQGVFHFFLEATLRILNTHTAYQES